MLDEWSGDDIDELFELLDTQLGDVGIDVKFDKIGSPEKTKKKRKTKSTTTSTEDEDLDETRTTKRKKRKKKTSRKACPIFPKGRKSSRPQSGSFRTRERKKPPEPNLRGARGPKPACRLGAPRGGVSEKKFSVPSPWCS